MALAYAPAPVARPTSLRRCRADQRTGGLRLTRRGRIAIMAVAVLALLALAPWRALAGAPAGAVPTGWTTISVEAGDTLWQIAEAAEPGADPRPMIAEIKSVNGLASSTLQPGQTLVVPQ